MSTGPWRRARLRPGPTASAGDCAPSRTGGETENRVRILADRRNNALLIYATPSEIFGDQGMLRRIDIIPLQVLIDATIAEVTRSTQPPLNSGALLGR